MAKFVKIRGKLQITSRGFGFAVPEGEAKDNDIFVPARDLGSAMNGDTVEVQLMPDRSGRRPEGKVVSVLERKFTKVVGVFVQAGNFAFVEPDDKHIGDVFVARENFNGAKHLDKVYVELTVYPDAAQHRKAEGRVLEVLGRLGDVGLEILSVIKQRELPLEFPKEVLAAAKRVPDAVKSTELKGREDRRQELIVTIDGEDAKDLDDAVTVRKVPGRQQWWLGVYIADVSHYVKEDGVIDTEAEQRGTSCYLVDRVIPMLPTALCNGICSLNEGVDRLVMACEMRINEQGTVLEHHIFPSVINSKHRLSYNIVRGILNGDKKLRTKYADCVPMLETANELRQVLNRMRHERGAINFELPEVKVILDEELRPVEVQQRVEGDAENLIEEFMLAANECVAKHLTDAKFPAVFRVHDTPKPEKIEALAKLLAMFGVVLPQDEDITPLQVQKALAQMEGRPEERLVSTVALRCMRQAVYQTENVGHFGLAAKNYVHFTSPIRRYPDLLIHRLLRKLAENGKLKNADRAALTERLDVMAEDASRRERLAAEAERETVQLKLCEYMGGYIGEEFDGFISGVTGFGVFVELPNGVEGMIRLENFKDDLYEFVEDRYAVIGIRTKKQHRLGDPMRILVSNVSIEDRTIDFEPVEDQPKPKPKTAKTKTAKTAEKKNGKDTSNKNHSGKPQSKARLQPAGDLGVRHGTAGNRSKVAKTGKSKSQGRVRTSHKKR